MSNEVALKTEIAVPAEVPSKKPKKEVAVKAPITFQQAIIEAAQDQKTDVSKMQALWEMHQKMEAHHAQKSFNEAMAAVQNDMVKNPIIRNRENSQTKSAYADLEAIYKVIKPILLAHGLRDSYEDDTPRENWVGTTCVLTHVDGHQSRNRVEFPFDNAGAKGTINKTGPHAAASSMTYGQRVSLCRALGIQIIRDDDGNAAGSQVVTEEQFALLTSLIEETGADVRKFCEHFEIEAVKDLPANRYTTARDQLKAKAKVKP